MDRIEERRLIKRAARGDHAAAEIFVRTYQHSVYNYILRMCGRPDVAEDVVQEAFVRALTGLDRFDPKFRFSTWLFVIARRVYLNWIQKHRPDSNSELVEARGGPEKLPEAAMTRSDATGSIRDSLQAALMGLPPDQREVLILFHQQEWSIRVIAQHLDIPEGTVKSHLHRGRKRLRILLEPYRTRIEDESEVLG